ncbi:glycoside hydrolase family 32 protein [Niabella sp. CC-SYL272]|uniref:glycoside hydrolase family 32 protein n=1 Tax=Niabella agricola TaxID=2891571 RepID=UPI001F29AEE3|nr:glycoside hydrolase family 32 protein [Niabella agricola]MCF3108845.1 glycoside hydrolase family 32 protein [Niabella agricola]
MRYNNYLMTLATALILTQAPLTAQQKAEPHRPQLHFSPKKGWMNDPNGMVFINGQYHLFFQHNPDATVWGPMHWGHAISTDLVHWKEQAIALYPDSLGTIFSGSAVIDVNNTAGFGKNAMVAVYTNHSHEGEKAGSDKFQNQSIAYSLDEGKTWTKYKGNPVLKNPGIRDFRDPKVSWYAPGKKWIMTLATLDHITFYSSPDLKNWKEESRFGRTLGAHGGVWECPDLISFNDKGKPIWVLIVNLNPGGPNGGSATQYFTGSFNGHTFTPDDTTTKWLDYGPDEYAGITWSNTGNRKLFLGWMSNWQYANVVPTKNWRSAMTLPRELTVKKINGRYFVASTLVKEVDAVLRPVRNASDIRVTGRYEVVPASAAANGLFRLDLRGIPAADFSMALTNTKGEEVVVGFDKATNQFYIDRTRSGNTGFEKGFAKRHVAPRIAANAGMNLTLIGDAASLELFADDGLTVMTSIFFPSEPLSGITIKAPGNLQIKQLKYGVLVTKPQNR